MSDEQMIKELGIASMPEALRENSLNQTKRIVALRVGGLYEAMMDEEQIETFRSLVNSGKEDEAWSWLSKTFVDADKLREEVFHDYVAEFKDQLKQL